MFRFVFGLVFLFSFVASARAVPGDLAVYFGSFDPFHEGHLAACQGAMPDLGVDSVLVIPHPDRNVKPTVADFTSRLAMVRAAAFRYSTLDSPSPEVVQVLRRGEPQWKQEVLGLLYQELPVGAVVQEIVGMDYFHSMLEQGKIPGKGEPHMLVVVDRPGYPLNTRLIAEKKLPAGKVLFLHPEVIDVDSSRVRQDIRDGKDVFGRVPNVVRKLIEHLDLY
jgi:nicotinate-nucleotide adenylyltransferase